MEQMVKLDLLQNIHKMELTPCQHCLVGKMTKKPFGVGHRENELLALIHSDVCGPLSVKTYNNKEYFVTFIDDYFRYAYVYLISRKTEVLSCFRKYKAEVEK